MWVRGRIIREARSVGGIIRGGRGERDGSLGQDAMIINEKKNNRHFLCGTAWHSRHGNNPIGPGAGPRTRRLGAGTSLNLPSCRFASRHRQEQKHQKFWKKADRVGCRYATRLVEGAFAGRDTYFASQGKIFFNFLCH